MNLDARGLHFNTMNNSTSQKTACMIEFDRHNSRGLRVVEISFKL